ncbi:MAG: I78 family peptidase inhibitor, partial [Comamonas sp.]
MNALPQPTHSPQSTHPAPARGRAWTLPAVAGVLLLAACAAPLPPYTPYTPYTPDAPAAPVAPAPTRTLPPPPAPVEPAPGVVTEPIPQPGLPPPPAPAEPLPTPTDPQAQQGLPGQPLPQPTPEFACNAEPAQSAVGQPYSPALINQVRERTGARGVRVLQPGQAVTQEYNAQRANLVLDADNKV